MSSAKLKKTAALLAISCLLISAWFSLISCDNWNGLKTLGSSPGYQSFHLVMSLVANGKWGWHPELPETVPPRQWALWTDGTEKRNWLLEFLKPLVMRWYMLHLRASVMENTASCLLQWTSHKAYIARLLRHSEEKEIEQGLNLFSLLTFKQRNVAVWANHTTTKEAIWV